MNLKSVSSEMDLFKAIMKLIAKQFGDKCEVVLHDWEGGYEKTIVAIENGHVTGRSIGDCGSNLGLEVMRGTSDGTNQYNYVTKTKLGKTLRSSSLYLINDEGKKIGALCINFDITDLLKVQDTVESLMMVESDVEEHFVNDVNELLEHLLQESIRLVGKVPEDMSKEEKMRVLAFLDEKGVFLITKSGTKICNFLGISKFTLYNYLDDLRGGSKK
jgi:predicted transcriptional regulator YheO